MDSASLKTAFKTRVSLKVFVYIFTVQLQREPIAGSKEIKKELMLFVEVVTRLQLIIPETRKGSNCSRLK